jgi:hypothetical protein
MKVNVILEKVSFLQLLDRRDWIDGGPHPMYRVSSAMYEMMLAQVLRSIAPLLQDRALGKQLHELGHTMVQHSSHGLVAGWEDGDDICPPWPWPWPPGWLGTVPDTAPALGGQGVDLRAMSLLEDMSGAVRDVVLATSSRAAARLTSDEKLSLALKVLGEQIVERAAGKGALFDDYCGTPVKPRPPRLARAHG